jgi:agmatinase
VCLTPASGPEAHDKIEQAMVRILENGCIPLTMGGDGAVTLPQLRAVRRFHDDLVVVHIDAHTDTYPIPGELDWQRFNTGTTFTHAANEGLVDPRGSWHIGARGPTYLPDAYATARTLGYTVVTNAELRTRGIEAVVKEVKASLAGRPVYLCWDMDVFDPSCAPGVCTPTWGGLSAAEGLFMLRSLAGLRMVAFDVNTVSPPHDSVGMTAFLAASCIREALFLACANLESRGVT